MAWPPYLMTTVSPWKRFSQGSASISVAALADASSTRPCSIVTSSTPSGRIGPSRRIGTVLVHVGSGQVSGQDDRGVRSGRQVHGDGYVLGGQVDVRAVLAGRPVAAHPDA